MEIKLNKGESGYEAVCNVVERWRDSQKDYHRCVFLVFMGTKFLPTEEYIYTVEILTDGGYSWVWENDWDEGQKYIDLVGITPVEDLKDPMIVFGGE